MSRVDRSALRVNQACIVLFLVLAFVLNVSRVGVALVAAVGAVMITGTILPSAGLFKLFYARVLRPLGIVRPDVIEDDPAQHLFAQGMGGAVLLIALVLFLAAHAPIAAWALVWLVIALALVNLVFGFCAGCFIYTQLHLRRLVGREA